MPFGRHLRIEARERVCDRDALVGAERTAGTMRRQCPVDNPRRPFVIGANRTLPPHRIHAADGNPIWPEIPILRRMPLCRQIRTAPSERVRGGDTPSCAEGTAAAGVCATLNRDDPFVIRTFRAKPPYFPCRSHDDLVRSERSVPG